VLPLFCPSLDHALYGGYEMETRHANAHLPLYGKGDALALVDKMRRTPNDSCLPLLVNQRRTILTCVSLLSEKWMRLGY
jgi:hypothetical protein